MQVLEYEDGLGSDRLTTRFLTKADAEPLLKYTSNKIATTYTAIPGRTPEEMALDFVEYSMARYQNNRLGLQALIKRDTKEFIGVCGLLVQQVNGQREIEVGYHLLPEFWGKGYATEAARLFRDFGFSQQYADSIVSVIHPLNVKSARVARYNGMKLVDIDAELNGNKYHLYRITNWEWQMLDTDK